MAGIKTGVQMHDGVSPTLKKMTAMMKSTNQQFQQMQQTSSKAVNVSSMQSANNHLGGMASKINTISNNVKGADSAQQKFNNNLRNGVGHAESLSSTIKKIAGAVGIMYLLNKVVDLNKAFGRMDTMTNFERVMAAITGDANAAKTALEQLKNTTRGTAYGLDTAAQATQDFVTRGLSIQHATDQVRKWSDAVAFYGKGTNEAFTNVMDAIQNMQATGKTDMLQLKRVMMEGIPIVDIYAKAVGKSTAQVREDLHNGEIASLEFIDTVSRAWDEGTNGVLNISGAAKQAGATWATTFANMKAAATRGIISIIDAIDAGLQRAGFGSIKENLVGLGQTIETVFNRIGQVIGEVAYYAGMVAQFIIDNWSWIKPVLEGVAVAIIAVKVATMIMTAAQWALNVALNANPLMWIFTLIGLVIGAIIAWADAVGGFEILWLIVCDAIQTAWAWVCFGFMTGVYWIVDAWESIKLAFSTAVVAVVGFMMDLRAKVLTALQGMVNGAIGLINNFIALLNSVLGTSIQVVGEVTFGTEAQLEAEAYKQAGQSALNQQKAAADAMRNEHKAKLDSMKANATTDHDKRQQEIKDKQNAAKDKKPDPVPDPVPVPTPVNDVGGNGSKTAGNTGRMADNMEMTSEDLKYLRDIAERKAINRFTTAKIDMGGFTVHNNVNSNMDLDGIADYIGEQVAETLESVAEGVHR